MHDSISYYLSPQHALTDSSKFIAFINNTCLKIGEAELGITNLEKETAISQADMKFEVSKLYVVVEVSKLYIVVLEEFIGTTNSVCLTFE